MKQIILALLCGIGTLLAFELELTGETYQDTVITLQDPRDTSLYPVVQKGYMDYTEGTMHNVSDDSMYLFQEICSTEWGTLRFASWKSMGINDYRRIFGVVTQDSASLVSATYTNKGSLEIDTTYEYNELLNKYSESFELINASFSLDENKSNYREEYYEIMPFMKEEPAQLFESSLSIVRLHTPRNFAVCYTNEQNRSLLVEFDTLFLRMYSSFDEAYTIDSLKLHFYTDSAGNGKFKRNDTPTAPVVVYTTSKGFEVVEQSIVLPSSFSQAEVLVYSTSGRVVHSSKVKNSSVDISELAKGFYLLKAQSGNQILSGLFTFD